MDRPDLYDPKINRSYAELAAHYGVLVDPARSRKPRDKARVERPISAYRSTGDPSELPYPNGDGTEGATGVAVFTRRGDAIATGWLDAYQSCTRSE